MRNSSVDEALSRESVAPLSPSQQAWFDSQAKRVERALPPTPFCVPLVFRLASPPDVERLERALNRLVARHEALRTQFVPRASLPDDLQRELEGLCTGPRGLTHAQYISPSASIRCTRVTIDSDERGADAAVVDWTKRQFARFIVADPPLMQVIVASTPPGSHYVVFLISHLIIDGWSMGQMITELNKLYASDAAVPKTLPPPGCYRDVMWSQCHAVADGETQSMRQYWTRVWSEYGRYTRVRLPFAKPAGPPGLADPAQTFVPSGAGVLKALTQHAHRHRASLHALLLAGVAVFLRRHADTPRLAVWTTFANRGRLELEHVVGWLAIDHIVGLNVTDDLTATSLLAHVRDALAAAAAHQQMSLYELWDAKCLWNQTCEPPAPDAGREVTVSLPGAFLTLPPRAADGDLLADRVTVPAAPEDGLKIFVSKTDTSAGLGAFFDRRTLDPADVRRVLETILALATYIADTPDASMAELLAADAH